MWWWLSRAHGSRSRSDLKMSYNKHLLLQRPFLNYINYHKIPLRIFLGDIRIPPMTQALAPLNPRPHPTPLLLHLCPIFLPKPLPHPLSLGHLVTLGPPTPPNLNISTIRVSISLGINSNQVLGIPTIYKRSAAYM